MKWLISYAIVLHADARRGHTAWSFANMVTDKSPEAWLVWAKTKNWAEETEYAADVVLLNALRLKSKKATKALEELLA